MEVFMIFLLVYACIGLLIWGLISFKEKNNVPPKCPTPTAQAVDYREVVELLDYLKEKLGVPLPEFRVQNFEYFFDRLTYEAHGPGAVSSVTDQVLRHYGLDSSKVRIETVFSNQKSENEEVRGQFQNAAAEHGRIRIVLTPEDCEFDSVVAVIMHECAHYFSEIHHTKLENKEKNERLTDLTAIWLGAGERMERGCFPRKNVQIGYLRKEECHYAIGEAEACRQRAIRKAEALRPRFATEVTMLKDGIDKAGCVLKTEVLCGDKNREKLLVLKRECESKQKQLKRVLTQMEHAMESSAYYEMNEQLLQAARTAREEAKAMLSAFDVFRPLTMEGVQLEQPTFTYYMEACVHARAGKACSQFEMIQFYSAHPSVIASEEAKNLMDELEASDLPDAQYLLGRCWNEGIFVSADQNAAVRCWVRAAGYGSEQAECALKDLRAKQMLLT